MSYSVSYVASLFHDFEEDEPELSTKNSKYKFSNKALILATKGANTKNLKTFIGNKLV